MQWFNKKRITLTLIIVVWILNMAFLIQKEYFPDSNNMFYANYQDILPSHSDTEQVIRRRMSISYGTRLFSQKIGTLQTTIYQRLDATTDIYTSLDISISATRTLSNPLLLQQLTLLFGKSPTSSLTPSPQTPPQPNNPPAPQANQQFSAKLETFGHIGPDRQLKNMTFDFKSGDFNITGKGEVENRQLAMEITTGDTKIVQNFPIPANSMMVDPLAGPSRFPKLVVGKKFEMRWFDPLTQQSRVAVSEVQAKITDYMWNRRIITVYVVYTKAAPFNTTAWVDENGEVLKYEIFAFTFTREPDE